VFNNPQGLNIKDNSRNGGNDYADYKNSNTIEDQKQGPHNNMPSFFNTMTDGQMHQID